MLLVCEHASNDIPAGFGTLGLSEADLRRHIAWDIGALELATACAARLDAPLVYATCSRLVIDVNRDVTAKDSIVEMSDGTVIPGNQGLTPAARLRRVLTVYEPFHSTLRSAVDRHVASRRPAAVVSIHTFTPQYDGVARPWSVGVISQHDRRLADGLLAELRTCAPLQVGDNQPYAPSDGVYHTLERHAQSRGIASAMIEVRNDEVDESTKRALWADRLGLALERALARIERQE